MDIVFDFDGVLCEYEGWRGHDKMGKPIKENINLVKQLYKEGHKLKLSTTRLNPFPFGKNKEGDEGVMKGIAYGFIKLWLEKNNIFHCFVEITGYKPFGEYYIDDRALRYGQEKDFKGTLLGTELYQILLHKQSDNFQKEGK